MGCWSKDQRMGLFLQGHSNAHMVWHPVSEEDIYIAVMALGSRKEVLQVSPD